MNRKLLSLLAACALFLPLACDNAVVNDPTSNPSFSASGNGQNLRDTDTNTDMPADTTVGLGDVINMALFAGNNGLQNNANVVWTNSNPVAVSLVPNKGTAVVVAQALGTSTVCATHGANSSCVVITVGAGPGVAYVVTSSSYATAAGSSVTISAQLVDVANNPAPEAGRIVTWSSTNGGSFTPVTSVTNGSGIATTSFTVSTVAGTTHVVTATDNMAASGSSAPILVQPGAAVNMVAYAGQGQSATVGTAVAVPPAVRVTDAFNNPVSGVIVNFTVTSGGGSATGTLQSTDANGVAAIGSWTLGNTPGTNTLDAISAGLPTVTFTATATVGGATQLAMSTQPSSTAQAGVAFAQQPAVQLKDALNNDVPTAGVVVTASIATGAGTLAGTLTATTDGSGLATFTDLRIDGATGTRTLRFQASGVTDAVSNAVNVVAGPADHLAMVTQPSATAQAGVAFAQQPSVRLEDQFNNPVAQSGVSVTAAIASGGGTLLGTTSVNTDANGVASYTDLAIAGTVGPRTLSFSATGVTSATSNTIDVGAGPVADILLTTPSTTVVVNSTITITGQLRDQYGNNVPQVASVSWSSTNGGSFSANPTNTDGTGQTTVDFTVASTGGVTHVVTATAGSATGTISITTINTAPVATDDAFDAIGNVTIPVPAPGVLANDTDAEQPVTAVPGTITTTNGGTVQMNADGSFTYLSAAGFTGTDTFNYTATDGTDSDVAQVTMNVPDRVWYAKNDATAPGDGRDASPFALLKDAELASAAGEWVLVFYGNGTVTNYDQGFVFKTGQSLIGQGIPADLTVTVNGVPVILLPAGNAPYVTRAMGGTTIELASNDTLRGLNIASANGAGIAGTDFGSFTASAAQVSAVGGSALELLSGSLNATFSQLSSSGSAGSGMLLVDLGGSLSAPAGSLTGAAGVALMISAGDGLINYGGSITSVVERPVFITGRTGGTVTVAGAINANGSGISVSDNSGGTVSFTGSASITTTDVGVALLSNPGTTIDFDGGNLVIVATGGTGFLANDGGTISVTGAGNTIAASGTGVQIQNTPIAADGVTFESVSVSNGSVGINLANTGSAGSLTVTGNGAAGSGGTIQNVTGDAVSLSGAARMDLRLMNIRPVVNGVILTNATGASSISRSTIDYLGAAPAGAFALQAINTSGTLTLTLDGTTIQNKLDGNTAVHVSARGNSTINFNVVDSNTADGFTSRFTNLFGSAMVVAAADAPLSTGVVNARVTDTEFVNAALNGTNNAAFSVASNGVLDYVIRGNLFDNVGRASSITGVIDINSFDAGRLGSTAAADTIAGNTIRNLGTGSLAAQLGYLGIRIAVDNSVGGINHNAVIANNALTNIWRQGMLISSRGQANNVNVRIRNNTIGTQLAPVGRSNRRALEIESQANSALQVEVIDNPSIVGAGTSSANASLAIRTGITTGSAFMNATVLNNTIGSTSLVTGARFRAETAATGTATMCLDLRNNSLENNTKTYDLLQSAGVFNVEGPGTGAVTNAAIQAQNTVGTGLVTGTVTFNNNTNCAQPTTP